MEAIGPDLVQLLVERHPRLKKIGERVRSIICGGGSDTANLDDMVIALLTGGLSLPQAILALLPEAPSMAAASDRLSAFHEAMSVFLGACDGPAAIVACDGDEAVAHLDRNGLRPLWLLTTKSYALAASELTGTVDLGPVEEQKLFGPGDTVVVSLKNGDVLLTDAVHRLVSTQRFPVPPRRVVLEAAPATAPATTTDLRRLQLAFGMTREDEDVLLAALAGTGKAAVGSMGDDTPPAAMLDRLPRRLEDHFKLRFAQETSPPIDPIRDSWVFETQVALGDRSGLWTGGKTTGPVYVLPERILSTADAAALAGREGVATLDLLFEATRGAAGLEAALDEIVSRGLNLAGRAAVIVLSDRGVDGAKAAVPALRAASRLHDALVKVGLRHRVGIVAEAGVWDIQHCALLVAVGADAVAPWLGCVSAGEKEKTYLKGLRGRFRRGHVDDGGDPGLGLLRREAGRGGGPRPRVAARGVPGRRPPPRRDRPGGARPRVAGLPRRGLPARRARGSARRRRVPLPQDGPPPRQQPRGLQGPARGVRLRGPRRRRSRLDRGLRGVRAHRQRTRADRHPRPPPHRPPRRARPARRGRGRGTRPLALHGAGDERGSPLRARPPRGRARDERAPPLLPGEVPPRRRPGAGRHRPDLRTVARAGSTRPASAATTATAASSTRGRASR